MAKHFDTVPELADRAFNRPRKETLETAQVPLLSRRKGENTMGQRVWLPAAVLKKAVGMWLVLCCSCSRWRPCQTEAPVTPTKHNRTTQHLRRSASSTWCPERKETKASRPKAERIYSRPLFDTLLRHSLNLDLNQGNFWETNARASCYLIASAGRMRLIFFNFFFGGNKGRSL